MFVDTWPNYNTTGLICWYLFWLAPAKIESVLEDRAVQATASPRLPNYFWTPCGAPPSAVSVSVADWVTGG